MAYGGPIIVLAPGTNSWKILQRARRKSVSTPQIISITTFTTHKTKKRLKFKDSHLFGLLDSEYDGTKKLRNFGNFSFKSWHETTTYHKAGIFSNTAVRTSNLAQ